MNLSVAVSLCQVRDARPLRVCWCGAPEGCPEAKTEMAGTDAMVPPWCR